MSYMNTIGGREFRFDRPRAESICILDIAHATALINRFNGHTSQPYSVAQHMVMVHRLLPREFQLHGLLHDAHEAYTGDNTRPFKNFIHGISELEEQIDRVLLPKFGVIVTPESLKAVKAADNLMLSIEALSLIPAGRELIEEWGLPDPGGERVQSWPWEVARNRYLQAFEELTA